MAATLRPQARDQGGALSLPCAYRSIRVCESCQRGPESTDAHHSRRILIIEDNRIGARSMRMLLEQIGHTVEVAHNGADGIEAARRFRPEVVLCDIGLPGLDGYAVARELRKESDLDGSFLIGVSGYAHDEQRAGEAGFNAYLLKPVNFRDLERMLAKV